MSERRSKTICAVVERPDRHCGDDLVSLTQADVAIGLLLLLWQQIVGLLQDVS